MRIRTFAVPLLAIGLLAVGPIAGAQATFPGANGKIAFSASARGTADSIYTMEADGSELQQIGPIPSYAPSWSPDGSRIAFGHRPPGGPRVIATMAADGTDMRILARDGYAPFYTPDGRKIIFGRIPPGPPRNDPQLVSMRADGTHEKVLMAAGNDPRLADQISQAEFRPDGKRILFIGTPEDQRRYGIWTVRRDGSKARYVSKAFQTTRGLSYRPDGRRIAISVSYDLRIIRRDGSTTGGFGTELREPEWAPEGDLIAGVGPCGDIYLVARSGDSQPVTGSCPAAGDGLRAVTALSWQPLPE